jgi:hypothetical protein
MNDTRVHVWGDPEHELEDDQRLCTDPDGDEVVVFHLARMEFGDGSRLCTDCALLATRPGSQRFDA